ncbi:hypothetical protein JGS22_016925 [Streptomyces sp. P38-E01]|uniref:DUF5709 domain-containing protein n=1 Tax=Streptomyces tardus TaxID=2780544 RepID=A0A949JIH9_9ACTN|nr:hypothetical protein [Streptomyces tardus]MBU7599250.1 hypothetical protein [Streptomyces tardus]
MPVDPGNPDTFEDAEGGIDRAPSSTGPEVPEADAAELRAEMLEESETPPPGPTLGEVDPADAAEQARTVTDEEDDYR